MNIIITWDVNQWKYRAYYDSEEYGYEKGVTGDTPYEALTSLLKFYGDLL